MSETGPWRSRVFARVGLIGNPSDGFGGAAIALSISNFFAEVWLEAADNVSVEPNPDLDPHNFASLQNLADFVDRLGYYGARRLLLAACRRFFTQCQEKGLQLPSTGFTVHYKTTIPRQLGLAGSSALVAATFDSLLQWSGLQSSWPVATRPSFVLEVETHELELNAGIVDRAAQVYGGAIFIDQRAWDPDVPEKSFQYLPEARIPPLWLMRCAQPSSSSRVHAAVKERWLQGDPVVKDAMQTLAQLADTVRERLVCGDEDLPAADLAAWMNLNFDTRVRIYGPEVVGAANMSMVQLARSHGAGAKLCGSGGGVLVCCPGGETQVVALLEGCEDQGFFLERLHINGPNFNSING